jgi:hypothetical protein
MGEVTQFDGGGFPMFRSYHDFVLPERLADPKVSYHVQFRAAFDDLVKTLDSDKDWPRRFTMSQVKAIREAILDSPATA